MKWGERFKLTYSKSRELVNGQISYPQKLFLKNLKKVAYIIGTTQLLHKLRSMEAKIAIILNIAFENNRKYYTRLAKYHGINPVDIDVILTMYKFEQYIQKSDLPKTGDLQLFRYLNGEDGLDDVVNKYWETLSRFPLIREYLCGWTSCLSVQFVHRELTVCLT